MAVHSYAAHAYVDEGGVAVLILLGVVAWATSGADESTDGSVLFALLMVVVLVAMVTFSRLSITVGDGRVTAAFWLGWPKRVVDLSEVTAVRPVRNSWWYGWGVRKVPGGWMYNVWGYDAIELELASGKVFRIGTVDPEGLEAALNQRRQAAGPTGVEFMERRAHPCRDRIADQTGRCDAPADDRTHAGNGATQAGNGAGDG